MAAKPARFAPRSWPVLRSSRLRGACCRVRQAPRFSLRVFDDVFGRRAASSFFPFTQQGANTFVLNQAFNSYSDPGPSNPIQC